MQLKQRWLRILMSVLALALAADGTASRGRVSARTATESEPGPHVSTWETLPTEPYPGKRDDISFADALHGWYGTGKGDLFATKDGGASWAKVASHPGTFIRALGFIDASTGYIGNVGVGYYPEATDETPLYRTDDGGVTWSAVKLGGATVEGICAIDILRTKRIHQGAIVTNVTVTAGGRVGGPASLVRSVDGGATWRVIDMSRWTNMILDVHFLDDKVGFVAGSSDRDLDSANAQILMTRDGGASWTEVYRSRRPSELVWKMSFPTALVGFGTVMSYDKKNMHKVVVKTVDGGRTWNELPLVSNPDAIELGIGFVDPLHGWVGSTIGGFETRDGGRSFSTAPIAKAANKFRIVGAGRGSMIFAIGTALQRRRVLSD
jgi:photosystem II stability/assembly factor-like uncharacterized protein